MTYNAPSTASIAEAQHGFSPWVQYPVSFPVNTTFLKQCQAVKLCLISLAADNSPRAITSSTPIPFLLFPQAAKFATFLDRATTFSAKACTV